MFTINSSWLSGRKSRHFLEAFLLNLVTRCHFFVTKITATSNRLKSRHTLLANRNIARVREFLVMVVIRHGAFPVSVYSTDSGLCTTYRRNDFKFVFNLHFACQICQCLRHFVTAAVLVIYLLRNYVGRQRNEATAFRCKGKKRKDYNG